MRVPDEAMPKGRAAVLLAIINLHALNGRVTVRQICAATGMRSTGTVAWHLRVLANEGLIESVKGRQATLRPLVQVTPL